MVLYHRRGILKVNVFKDPCLNKITCADPFQNVSFSRNFDIKITNAKSVTDASIWVIMVISKNSNMLEIEEHSLFNSPIIIRRCGFYSRSTDLADKPDHTILGQFVNEPG